VGHSGTADSVVDNGGQGVSIRPTDVLIGSTGVCLYLNRENSDGILSAFRKDGATVGSIGTRSSLLRIGSGDTGLLFLPSGDTIIPENIDGNTWRDAAIDLGNSAARFKDLYLSGGVVFGPASASNISSQTLDDYEQGNWFPTVTSSGGTITSVTSPLGTYTKIGRLVTLQYQFIIATLGTASGNIIVSGRPFTEDNSVISYYAGVHRARAGASSVTEFDPDGTLQLYGMTPVAGVYHGTMVYNTAS
jgi:hypothetical protein